MDDALRSNVHIGAGCHLAVLGYTKGVEALPVVLRGVVRDHHSVGHDDSRGVLVAREESEWMAGVHDEGLLLRHCGEIFHRQTVLGPVLEDGSVAAVGDELVRMLGHSRVQIVLYHCHDRGSLGASCRILVYRAGVHRIVRTQAVHIDAAVFAEFTGELRGECTVLMLREIP